MINRDNERIDRLFQYFSERDIDYVVGYNDILVKYLSGNFIDYSLVLVDIKNEKLVGIINVMEGERAHETTWLDEIVVYGGKYKDYKSLDKSDPISALAEYLGKKSFKIGIPYDSITYSTFRIFQDRLKGSILVDVAEDMWRLRMKKSRYEQDLLSHAGEVVDYGIYTSIKSLKEGISERELALKGRCSMYEFGADKVYDFLIVASGVNSANPHWRALETLIKEGDVITFDYVASYEGYYGDETRTVFYKSVSKDELKKIYEIVLDAQVSAIDIIEPGVKASDVDRKAREIIEKNGYGKYFIHSTGHGVGLEVHERPRVSKKDSTVLEDGYVITVEPGIYVPDIGGVRIEDMVLVTKKGHKLLTKLNKAFTVV